MAVAAAVRRGSGSSGGKQERGRQVRRQGGIVCGRQRVWTCCTLAHVQGERKEGTRGCVRGRTLVWDEANIGSARQQHNLMCVHNMLVAHARGCSPVSPVFSACTNDMANTVALIWIISHMRHLLTRTVFSTPVTASNRSSPTTAVTSAPFSATRCPIGPLPTLALRNCDRTE